MGGCLIEPLGGEADTENRPVYWLRSHVWGMDMNAFFTRCAFYCPARLNHTTICIQICVLLYYVVYYKSTEW